MSDTGTSPPAEAAGPLAEAVVGLLAAAGRPGARVGIVGAASAGAMRSTSFATIDLGDATIDAVVQVAPVVVVGSSFPMAAEAELLRIAVEAGVPVPPVLAAGAVEGVGEILVTGRVDGETIPRRVLRLLESGSPEAGTRLARQCGAAMALLHAVDVRRLPAAIAPSDPGDPAAAFLGRLTDLLDSLPVRYPTFRYAIRRLGERLPSPPERPVIVHGDIRTGNLIVDGDGLAAVLDWELARSGDPMEDASWLCLRSWRFGNDHLEVGGFAHLPELRKAYEAAGGTWRDDAFSWWTIARTVQWGIGLAGQSALFEAGVSRSIVHAASGRRVVELEYDTLALLEPPAS